jgi:hypothetical protein
MPLSISVLLIFSGLAVIATGFYALTIALIMMSFRPVWQQCAASFFSALLILFGLAMVVLPIVWLFIWK